MEKQSSTHDKSYLWVMSPWSKNNESIESTWHYSRGERKSNANSWLWGLLFRRESSNPCWKERLSSLWCVASEKNRRCGHSFYQGSSKIHQGAHNSANSWILAKGTWTIVTWASGSIARRLKVAVLGAVPFEQGKALHHYWESLKSSKWP